MNQLKENLKNNLICNDVQCQIKTIFIQDKIRQYLALKIERGNLYNFEKLTLRTTSDIIKRSCDRV
ncbi:hypothetical protein BpHYR1_036059 [Brachionus plicatilis]|uniref:Uncharacterized protein n=1 Tax=Brachionus plicatilis TaxID=10195 RepID=A0A3M7RYX5_BRAPC|nr:hypothetical protein BpHYR1_036059 [Brachionus plicatilis]